MITIQDLYQFMLFEKRRNPDQNPKISAHEYLEKYKDDPDIYISFSNIPKIGINPKSDFNTPLGIYTYPLKEIWKQRIGNRKETKDVPFAGDRKYIFILRSKNKKKFVNDMYKDYTSKDYDTDMDKLRKLYGVKYTKKDYDKDVGIVLKIIERDWNRKKKNEMKKIFDKNKKATKYNNYFKSFVDTKNETQSGIWVGYWKHTLLPETYFDKYKKQVIIEDIIEHGTEEAKGKNPITSMWNVTRVLANSISGKPLVQWNKILRQLGYTGFADKSGKGIIHRSEPTQAVFLTKDAFKVEDMVLNKKYESTLSKEDMKEVKKLGDVLPDVKDFELLIKLYRKVKKHAPWLLKAKIEQADFGVMNLSGTVLWYDGIWRNGTWEEGQWRDGEWKNGTWKKGTWYNGAWEKGTWKKGDWANGSFMNGVWEEGTWVKGKWFNGTWKNGRWHGGEWKGGSWENGIWITGTWEKGEWKKGQIWDAEERKYIKSDVSPKEYFENKEKNK